MKYLEGKSFQHYTFEREPEEDSLIKQGYEKRNGYWIKCKLPMEHLIVNECKKCGKIKTTNIDMASLDAWEMCKECYIIFIEGREERMITVALGVIINIESIEDEIKDAIKFLRLRGARRWLKANAPSTDALNEINKLLD